MGQNGQSLYLGSIIPIRPLEVVVSIRVCVEAVSLGYIKSKRYLPYPVGQLTILSEIVFWALLRMFHVGVCEGKCLKPFRFL